MTILLPGAAPPALTGIECREALKRLASAWGPQSARSCACLLTLAVLAHESLDWHRTDCTCGHCVGYHWAALRHDMALLDGLLTGGADWRDVDEDYATLADPWGTAVEDVEMRVAAGLDVLALGEGGRR